MSRKGSGSRLSPHQEATKASDLPKRLGQELQGHFEVNRDLPHSMLTLVMQLPKQGRGPLPKRRCRTKAWL
jgi:hypothetical protein